MLPALFLLNRNFELNHKINQHMLVALTYNQKKEDISDKHPDYDLEFDDPSTIEAVAQALSVHYDVVKIEGDANAFEQLLKYRPDIVFNIAEGEFGESREAQIPAMLDMLKIPYTGSNPLTLSLCLNKAYFKKILTYHEIMTPGFEVMHGIDQKCTIEDFPVIVKPLWEGSSKGIFNNSIAHNSEELEFHVKHVVERYKQPALVENFIGGREFTVAVLGNKQALKILPIVEIDFRSLPEKANPIYSYEAKWIWDREEDPLDIFTCPAELDPQLKQSIEDIVLKTYRALECLDWSRIDVRLDVRGKPHILEVNPLPGILPNPESNSCFPKAARTQGINYNELINLVLEIALKRYNIAHETTYCRRYL